MKPSPYPKLAEILAGMTFEDRKALAAEVGTKLTYLRHVAGGRKRIGLALALALVKALPGLKLTDLPVSQRDCAQWDEVRGHLAAPSKTSV